MLRERKAENPLISLSVFRIPGFVLGLVAIVVVQFIVLGLSFLLPNYAQLVMGAGETEGGTTLLAGCIIGAIMTPFAGGILDRLGPRVPIITGLVAMTTGLILLTAPSSYMPTTTAMAIYAVFAFGQSLTIGNTMTTALAQLPEQTKSDGNAVINTLQQLAGAMGTSVVTLVVGAAQEGASDMAAATMLGTREAYLMLAILILVPIVCMLTGFAIRGALLGPVCTLLHV